MAGTNFFFEYVENLVDVIAFYLCENLDIYLDDTVFYLCENLDISPYDVAFYLCTCSWMFQARPIPGLISCAGVHVMAQRCVNNSHIRECTSQTRVVIVNHRSLASILIHLTRLVVVLLLYAQGHLRYTWTINEPHPTKRQARMFAKPHTTQLTDSSAMLGGQEDGDCYLMH